MRELCFQTKIAAVLKCTFSSSHTECQQICFFLSVHLLPSSLLFSTTAVFSGKHQPLTTWPTPNYTQTNWWSSWWTKWSIYKLNSLHCTTTNLIFFFRVQTISSLDTYNLFSTLIFNRDWTCAKRHREWKAFTRHIPNNENKRGLDV